jgi:hypothetical protein
MPVRLDQPPSLANNALVDGLRSFGVPEGARVAGRLWQAEQVAIPRPVPLYTSTLQSAIDGRVLEEAYLAGWLYFVHEGEQLAALAEVALSPMGQGYTLLSLSRSAYNEAAGTGLSQAVQIAEEHSDDLHLRILRIPALYFLAIWLHGDTLDRIISLPPAPFGLEPFEILTGGYLTILLQQEGEKQLTQSNRP